MSGSVPILAVKRPQAAKMLSISLVQLWRLTARGKIKVLSCGTIAIAEIERYIAKESR